MRAVVVGEGRMGRAVRDRLLARGHEVLAWVTAEENAGGAALTRERLAGAHVAIEFTVPQAAPGNVERLLRAGIPVVSGTTGWDGELPRLRALAESGGGAFLHAPNFSIGVALFLKAAAELARRFADQPEFGGYILDLHHAAKQDAPSGTGRLLQRVVAEASGRPALPVTSVRAGHLPGTHTLAYDGPFESVSLTHEARDRAVFAQGAVLAAEWLVGRTGSFTFDDVLFGSDR